MFQFSPDYVFCILKQCLATEKDLIFNDEIAFSLESLALVDLSSMVIYVMNNGNQHLHHGNGKDNVIENFEYGKDILILQLLPFLLFVKIPAERIHKG
jgi:hypothetical protein